MIQVVLSRIQKKLSTEKQIKTKQTNKNKTNKQTKKKTKTKTKTTMTKTKQNKIKQLTIYESLKLICTCKWWSIHLLVFIRVISLTTERMVLDLHVARVTAFPEIDGTFNVKN